MNFSNILNHIETVDPEVYERLSPRRSVIRTWMRGAALTALPLALGSMFKKAYGQTTTNITDVLNFALTLEYLESEFYRMAIVASEPPFADDPLIPIGIGLDQPAIRLIYAHESAHVSGLQAIIRAAGGAPVAMPKFDFSAGSGSGTGPFQAVFQDFDVFLAVAQTFEDTGVRAYKGAAPLVMSNNDVLTAALRIHSVEARHAAHIRSIRRLRPSSLSTDTVNLNPRPWITGNRTEVAGADVQASYAGEEITLQSNIQIVNINGKVISQEAATQSFDEPLDMAAVLAIVKPFLVP